MIQWPPRERLLVYLLWSAGGLAVVAAVAVLVLPLGGGQNRIALAAVPFAIAAAACAALVLLPELDRWLSLLLYALTALAITYALMNLASLPLRLSVLGECPPAPATCTAGFEPAMTGGETLGVGAGITIGIIALLVAVAAMEVRYRPRLRIIGGGKDAQPQAAPPPQMRPSAIVKRPAGEPANKGSRGDSPD